MSEKKTALVTGANKGIGYEIAAGLGALGFRVGVGARDPEALRGRRPRPQSRGDRPDDGRQLIGGDGRGSSVTDRRPPAWERFPRGHRDPPVSPAGS